MDNAAKKKAKKLLIQFGISKLTLDSMLYVIESQGYEVIEYSQSDTGSSAWMVINNLNLCQYANSGKAFAYQKGRTKLIFVCEDLSADEKLYALAHEEGHILCGHLIAGVCDGNLVEQEYQANEVAHYLINPPFYIKVWIKLLEQKKLAVTIISVIGVLAVVLIIAMTVHRNSSYYGHYYITKNGSKYHEEDCIIIKDKSNTRRLTEEDFASGEYEPCQVCLPN